MCAAFESDGYEPGSFHHGYVANVAMVLHDMQPDGSVMDFRDQDTREAVANRGLAVIFGMHPMDREGTDGGEQ